MTFPSRIRRRMVLLAFAFVALTPATPAWATYWVTSYGIFMSYHHWNNYVNTNTAVDLLEVESSVYYGTTWQTSFGSYGNSNVTSAGQVSGAETGDVQWDHLESWYVATLGPYTDYLQWNWVH